MAASSANEGYDSACIGKDQNERMQIMVMSLTTEAKIGKDSQKSEMSHWSHSSIQPTTLNLYCAEFWILLLSWITISCYVQVTYTVLVAHLAKCLRWIEKCIFRISMVQGRVRISSRYHSINFWMSFISHVNVSTGLKVQYIIYV